MELWRGYNTCFFFHKLFSCNIPAAGKVQFLGFVYVCTYTCTFCLDHLFPVALMNLNFMSVVPFLTNNKKFRMKWFKSPFCAGSLLSLQTFCRKRSQNGYCFFPSKITTWELPACIPSLQSLCNVNLHLLGHFSPCCFSSKLPKVYCSQSSNLER